jgi:hypothetical protein
MILNVENQRANKKFVCERLLRVGLSSNRPLGGTTSPARLASQPIGSSGGAVGRHDLNVENRRGKQMWITSE